MSDELVLYYDLVNGYIERIKGKNDALAESGEITTESEGQGIMALESQVQALNSLITQYKGMLGKDMETFTKALETLKGAEGTIVKNLVAKGVKR